MNTKIKKRARENSDYLNKKIVKFGDDVSFNQCYLKSDFITEFHKAVMEKTDITFANGAQFFVEPFSCAILPNFVSSTQFVEALKQELNQVKLHAKDSDLFQFKQSDDLATAVTPCIKKLINILYNECRVWLEKVTDFSLTDEIDMTCSRYDFTDVLLCHDDMLKGRRIAFIYYLVSDWQKEDGGTLDLFETENENAGLIKRSIIPTSNSFLFFEVSPKSFHQVSEVLKEKSRLSVNGWFHSDSYESKLITKQDEKVLCVPRPIENDNIMSWINPLYFEPQTIYQIRKEFSEASEIELTDFLQEEKYKSVAIALKSEMIDWQVMGPRNKMHFYKGTSLPSIVEKCQRILNSEEMCLILSNLTGLRLHPSAEADASSDTDESDCESTNSNAKLQTTSSLANFLSVIRKWNHCCYTLLHDNIFLDDKLDTILYFNCNEWCSEFGGFTSYVAKGDSDELLRTVPKSNSLALIYTDKETASFVKYINSHASIEKQNSNTFYDIFTTFYEQK